MMNFSNSTFLMIFIAKSTLGLNGKDDNDTNISKIILLQIDLFMGL